MNLYIYFFLSQKFPILSLLSSTLGLWKSILPIFSWLFNFMINSEVVKIQCHLSHIEFSARLNCYDFPVRLRSARNKSVCNLLDLILVESYWEQKPNHHKESFFEWSSLHLFAWGPKLKLPWVLPSAPREKCTAG